MEIIKGKSVSNGIAFGNIVYYDSIFPTIAKTHISDCRYEIKKFFKASADALNQIQTLYEKALHIAGEAYAKIFSIHQMMLQDDDYINSVIKIIETQKVNAEYAVYLTSKTFSSRFLEMDNNIMRARFTDIVDVSNHILNNLVPGKSKSKKYISKNQIIVSNYFTPSQIISLEKNVNAVVAGSNMPKSHAAYLVRKMQIPAVNNAGVIFDKNLSGRYAAVNGFTGEIYIDPDNETVDLLKNRQNKYVNVKKMVNIVQSKKTDNYTKNRIKLIALDLDGTIIRNGNTLSDKSVEVINKAASENIVMAVCTGRVMGEVPEAVKKIKGIQYFITSNGASISDNRMNVIYNDTIPANTALKIIDILRDYNCLIDLYINGCGYIQKSDAENLEKYNIESGFIPVLKTSRILVENICEFYNNVKSEAEKINLFFADLQERSEAISRLNQLIPPPKITYSMENNLEINSHTCCKGQGIHFLSSKLGIDMSEIMTIGDSNNDISMLEPTGFSVAMGNAPSNVKQTAVYVTETCENDGAALAIEKYALRV